MAAAILDLAWHSLSSDEVISDVEKFEQSDRKLWPCP